MVRLNRLTVSLHFSRNSHGNRTLPLSRCSKTGVVTFRRLNGTGSGVALAPARLPLNGAPVPFEAMPVSFLQSEGCLDLGSETTGAAIELVDLGQHQRAPATSLTTGSGGSSTC